MAEQLTNCEDFSSSQITALRECKTSFELNLLNLKNKVSKKLMINRNGIATIISAMAGGKDLDAAIDEYVNSYIEAEWYNFKPSYDAARERTSIILKRLAGYLDNYIKDALNISYSVNLSYPFNTAYYNVPIRNIYEYADIVLDRNEYIEVIKVCSGMPIESAKARKVENLPENSLLVSILYAGARQLYPDRDIKVSLFYLINKDDKGTNYMPYESKEGKNIVHAAFSDVDPMQHLKYVMCFKVPRDCNNCLSKSCCQFSSMIYENKDTNEEIINGNFEPTKSQKEVINHLNGPMLVEAAPGTGKTASLVNRLNTMVNSGINPENILMITFTNKARDEIKQRVSHLFNDDKLPHIETFNSCGYNILRDNPTILGGDIRLADDIDRKVLTEKALKDCADEGLMIDGVNYSNFYGQFGLINTVYGYFEKIESYGREGFILAYKDKKDVYGLLAVYEKYQLYFQQGNYISYDEQITLVNKLFNNNPKVLETYQDKFKYIMVDEFQDINLEQFNMVYSLSLKYRNIVCVGDCDQAIYSFRGGSNKFALEFKDYYPDTKLVYMVDNFRCTEPIVDVANALILNNSERYDKKIVAHKSGTVVSLYENLPTGGEAVIYNNCLNNFKPGEIAIISRTNKMLSHFGEIIAPDNSLKPKDYVVTDSVFNALRDIISLKVNGFDNDEALYRCLIIAGATRKDLLKLARDKNSSLYNDLTAQGAIPKLGLEPIEEHSVTSLWTAAMKIKNSIKEFAYGGNMENILRKIVFHMFGYENHPCINVLLQKADERCIKKVEGLLSLMDNMVLFEDTTRVGYGESINKPNLLTAHDSKGKEFPCVILYGIEDFRVDEESRRVLYVALTRAKEKLIIINNFNSESMLPEIRNHCRNEYLQERRANG